MIDVGIGANQVSDDLTAVIEFQPFDDNVMTLRVSSDASLVPAWSITVDFAETHAATVWHQLRCAVKQLTRFLDGDLGGPTVEQNRRIETAKRKATP